MATVIVVVACALQVIVVMAAIQRGGASWREMACSKWSAVAWCRRGAGACVVGVPPVYCCCS